jgi:hypothetical protein
MIDGPTPMHLTEAPTPGTGKGLLNDVISIIALGGPATLMSEGRDEDEWRKRITSTLLDGPSLVQIDNLRGALDSAALSAAITAPRWSDRILGQSKVAHVPVRCVWSATANNAVLSTEMARRTVRIRLDAELERPWERFEFKHPDLRGYARQRRGDLVAAVLTMVRAWFDAGQPANSVKPLGSFESWSAVIGGVLEVAGVGGFLGNTAEFYSSGDSETDAIGELLQAWWAKYKDRAVGVSELFVLTLGLDSDIDLGDGSDRSQRIRLGKLLLAQRGRVFGDMKITEAGKLKGASQWRLTREGTQRTLALAA